MATGDQSDVVNRLQAVLPPWFPAGGSGILNTVLQGAGWVLSQIYELIAFARLQTRIATATGGWLDLVSYDFFGRTLLRDAGEADAAFRIRITANLLQPAGTRPALVTALTSLTAGTPQVIDPWRPSDCGAYGYGGLGYGVSGYYGSLAMHAQTFVIVSRSSLGSPGDAAVYQVIASAIPSGVLAWVALEG